MLIPLLQTKFYIPPPRPHQVRRDHLINRLRDQGGRRLTLISAPAGFGKTTLVNEWVSQSGHAAAWLSLDEDDNEPTHFLTYLIASLQTCQEKIGVTALALLATPQASPKAVLTLLLNDLGNLPVTLTLILDDYHVITTPLLHEAMTFLIEHLPPTLHVVITSRIDPPLPLARWRARNHVVELRADDLRFGIDETATFLNGVMGLQLTAADVAALETRTEGWIAGLQLAALSLQGRQDGSAFIRTFSGSHRHILGYLLEEVLNRQPDEMLRFLMQTSVLDRMCGALCDAVTGQTVGSAMLTRLEQANLFIVPLDDEGRWYRYHHLFKQVLYARLQQTHAHRIAELHNRASSWCEQQGLLDEAMRQALAIPGLDLAASLLERHALPLLTQSELMLLRKWVAQLPSELIHTRPRLVLAQGWVLVMVGQLDAAAEVLKTLALQTVDFPPELAGERALLMADLANLRRDPMALTWAQQALELIPLHREDLRTIALNEIGLAYMRRGALTEAHQTLQEVVTRTLAGENRFVAVDASAVLHLLQVRQGQLFKAVEISEHALRMVGRWAGPTPPATGMLYIGLGEVLCEWNELDRAAEMLAHGLKLLQGTIEKMPLVRGYVAQARMRQAQDDPLGALACLAQAEAWFAELQIADSPALTRLFTQRARLWIQQGSLEAAHRWASESRLPAETELACEYKLSRVRLHLALLRRSSDAALFNQAFAELAAVRALAAADDWPAYRIEELMLRALTLHLQHNIAAAFHLFTEALTQAAGGGYIRLFVDEGEPMRLLIGEWQVWIADQIAVANRLDLFVYIAKLLAAFPFSDPTPAIPTPSVAASSPPPVTSALVEPLSYRELEVLQLIAVGLSNREVAAKLVVTVGTVKSHVNHIFSKLAVVSRTQAIARARSLGLLDE